MLLLVILPTFLVLCERLLTEGRLKTTLLRTSVTAFMLWVFADDTTAESGISFLSVKSSFCLV
jgi:hypothetical protein